MKTYTWSDDRMLPFSIIDSATQGDVDAISAVLKHFKGYIATLATRILYDEYGNPHKCLDTDLQCRLENKLVVAIVQKFKAV